MLAALRMKLVRNYRFGFDPWGLALFLLIMAPNLIWFAVPAPNDLLRGESVTPVLDTIASVCQAVMVAALCLVQNKKSARVTPAAPATILTLASALFYSLAWCLYYGGIVHAGVILGLCVFPCLAFLFYLTGRKNYIALLPAAGFTVCHLLYGILNYIVP